MGFATSADQKLTIYVIATAMQQAGLSSEFITEAVELAVRSEGVFELMSLWHDEQDADERDVLLADIQEALDEQAELPPKPVEKAKLPFDELDDVARKVIEFKAELRRKVDRWGGVTKLAAATGMPQPSLSRFFSTASMPRRTTLYKIARALDLSEAEIAFDWVV